MTAVRQIVVLPWRVNTVRVALCVGVAVAPLLAATVVSGPAPVVAVAVGALLGMFLLPRLEWTIGLAVFVNLLAVARGAIAGSPVTLAAIAQPARSLLLGLLVVQAVRVLAAHRLPLAKVVAPVAPLIVVMWLSILAAPSLPGDWIKAIPFSLFLVSIVVVAWAAAGMERVLQRTICGVACAYGGIAVLNVLLLPLALEPFLSSGAHDRFQGLLENPNSVGVLGFGGVPALIFAGVTARRASAVRYLAFSVAILCCAEVVLSLSRGGLAGLVIALLVLFVGLTRRRLGVRTIIVAVALGALLVVVSVGVTQQLTASLRLDSVAQAGGRANIWPYVLDLVPRHPVLGYGYGSSPEILLPLQNVTDVRREFTGRYAGNVALDSLLEMGVLGLLAIIGTLSIVATRVARLRVRTMSQSQNVAVVTCAAVVIGGLANGQSESILLLPGGAGVVVFWLAVGICSAVGIHARPEHLPAVVNPGRQFVDRSDVRDVARRKRVGTVDGYRTGAHER